MGSNRLRNLQLSNKLPASNYVNKQGHSKRQQENDLNEWNVVKHVWSFLTPMTAGMKVLLWVWNLSKVPMRVMTCGECLSAGCLTDKLWNHTGDFSQ